MISMYLTTEEADYLRSMLANATRKNKELADRNDFEQEFVDMLKDCSKMNGKIQAKITKAVKRNKRMVRQ